MTYNDTDSERALARRFFTEYDKVVDENARLRADNDSYKHENAALVAEVNMLREELERSDRDRMRLQGFSSTLVARLTVIRETIENAAREAIRQSIPEKLPETPIITEQQISEQQQHDKLQEIVNKLPRIDMN